MFQIFRAEHASSLDVVTVVVPLTRDGKSAHLILFRGLGGNRPALGVLNVAYMYLSRSHHIVNDTRDRLLKADCPQVSCCFVKPKTHSSMSRLQSINNPYPMYSNSAHKFRM